MTYSEFRERRHFTREELLALGYGRLVDDPPEGFKARLPLPPMLMVDRIEEISRDGRRGRLIAERDVRLDDWFYHCHFLGDPVQPGCLGVDAVWQMVGFYCAWNGALGTGRALGCREVEFSGQIRPYDGVVRYEIDIVRYQDLPTPWCVSTATRSTRSSTRRSASSATSTIRTIRGPRATRAAGSSERSAPWPVPS